MNQEITDKVMAKLQKLLALSASPNEAEASAAMLKCQELMLKYDIRVIDVDPVSRVVGVDSKVVESATGFVWERHLASDIARALDAQVVLIPASSRKDSWSVCFMAGKTDLSLVTDLFKTLRRTVSIMGRNYADGLQYTQSRVAARNSYCVGAVASIGDNLKKVYATPVEVAATTALVVVKKDAIAALFKELYPRTRNKKSRSSAVDAAAYHKGREDGKRVGVCSKSIGV